MVAAYKHLWGTMNDFLMPFFMVSVSVIVVTPFIILLARKFNVLDVPNERKIHNTPIPCLGGLGLLVVLWGVALMLLPWTKQFAAILLGATLISIMGIVDDIRSLSSRIRLVGQVVASFIVMSVGIHISFMPDVWWGDAIGALITLLWILGIINALNFADGLDGLASGITVIASTFFFLIAIYLRQFDVALVAALTSGLAFGFLFWNFKPAKIYLGDGGSTLLGFLLACLALYGGWSADGFIVALGIPTIILGVLIFDMIYITLARIKNGLVTTFQEWLDYTGRDHFHHRLMSLGFGEVRAVVFIYLVCIILGLNVLVLERLRNPLAVTIIFVNSSLVFLCIFLLMRVGHVLVEKKDE